MLAMVTTTPLSPRCPATDHLRAAVSTIVLGTLHSLAIHAIRAPVNSERRVANAARDAELIPEPIITTVAIQREQVSISEVQPTANHHR